MPLSVTQWGYRAVFDVEDKEILSDNGLWPMQPDLATVATRPNGKTL